MVVVWAVGLDYIFIFYVTLVENICAQAQRLHASRERESRGGEGPLVGFGSSEWLTSSNLAPLFIMTPNTVGENATIGNFYSFS